MPIDICWGTYHRLMAAIVQSKAGICQALSDPRIRVNSKITTEAEILLNELSDNSKFQKLLELEGIFRSLTSCIKFIEGDAVDPSDAYLKITEAFSSAIKQIEHSTAFDEDIRSEIKEACICKYKIFF